MTREKIIKKNIKRLKQSKELFQDWLSKLANVSIYSIIKLVTCGITNLPIESLYKIAKALGVSARIHQLVQ